MQDGVAGLVTGSGMDIECGEPDTPPPLPNAGVLCRFCGGDAARKGRGKPRNAPTLEGALSTQFPVPYPASTAMCSSCEAKIRKAKKKREAHALHPPGDSQGKKLKLDSTTAAAAAAEMDTDEPGGHLEATVAVGEGQQQQQQRKKKAFSVATLTEEKQAGHTIPLATVMTAP
jgi:hypothetical protein